MRPFFASTDVRRSGDLARAAERLAAAIEAADRLAIAARATVAPSFDLAVRLWIAQAFWLSGMVKLHDWTQALYLAHYEYPVSWLNPDAAAWLGAAIEIVCPPLLAFGLATRAAAFPMLLLMLVSHVAYRASDASLFSALLLTWFVATGAGPVSIDHFVAGGIVHTPVPFARRLAGAAAFLSRWGKPVVQLGIRATITAVLLRGVVIGHLDVALLGAVPIALGLLARAGVLPLLGSAALAMMHAPSAAQLGWIMLLGLVAVFGPGIISLDHVWYGFLRRWLASRTIHPDWQSGQLPRVVIVGGGFGGIAAARGLAFTRCAVTLIDRHNYHLFQPLLYRVATAGLSPADVAVPIRCLLRDQNNVRVLLGTVVGIDRARRSVLLANEMCLPYDYLVLATGAQHSYFGRDDWSRFAPGLKAIEDATEVRRRLLLAFEQAEAAEDPATQRDLLTFAIVGGGPTGVELAGAVAELARHGLARDFRRIDPASARIILVQSGKRILPAFPESLSAAAAASLRALGVEVLTGGAVEQIDAGGILVSGERIRCRTFWCAGVTASPATSWLGAPSDQAGRVEVAPDLSVPGAPDTFIIGDTAASHAWAGKIVPGLGPAAKQGGLYVAAVIRARLEDRPPPAPFRYRHAGSLATIGRKAAVADFGRVRLSGGSAWWLWGAVHILFLAGVRNRAAVAIEWFWFYLTFRSSTRLITGDASDIAPTRGDPQRSEPGPRFTPQHVRPESALG